ncbi:YolD-like family protein [Bacillus fonticola]|uniref:YolD-like family protein n=1 Tax=Bacillus fonticola TaxID=2728853 RepID=UPI00147538FB|nr:YolD-like family protein [Bacillus fonticola]
MMDRGAAKWSMMMLPEHKKMHSDLYQEQKNVQKPILDEQKIDELNEIIRSALLDKSRVGITFYRKQRFHTITGFVSNFDYIGKSLQVLSEATESHYIPLEDILEVAIVYP